MIGWMDAWAMLGFPPARVGGVIAFLWWLFCSLCFGRWRSGTLAHELVRHWEEVSHSSERKFVLVEADVTQKE